jgi:hypothetical protein
MEKRPAQLISIVFHPLLIPTYGLLILLSINTYFTWQLPLKAKVLLTFMVFTSTVVIPLILFAIFKRKYLISDFHMRTKEERLYPYLSLTVIYFLLYLLISKTDLHPIFSFFLLATALIALAVFFINMRYKISVHTAGMGGLTAMLTGLSFKLQTDLLWMIEISIFCSGLVGFARLKTNSHKPSEVYSGYLVGAVIFLIMFLIF